MMNFSRLILALTAVTLVVAEGSICRAQNTVTEQQIIDSTSMVEFAPLLDSTLAGVDILSLVDVNQSDAITEAFDQYTENNKSRQIAGYRVRIFFDNSRSARTRSEEVARKFAGSHPGVKVYRSHVNPYFKVTVGNFRTRDEAQKFAGSISGTYPSVFLVKEHIQYPDL